ncbi:MAG: DegV family protein [Dehalococcoidia bacterium]|nr:DegV family protein [Dehalococcoidia bacterium]
MQRVRVVTDSTADLDPQTAGELGIEVLPIYVRCGDKTFRDGVDISPAELYTSLDTLVMHPTTAQPGPEDFARVYSDAPGMDIVSVHISSHISGTCNSARIACGMLAGDRQIEIVDSKLNSAGLALVAMAAARVARMGAAFEDVVGVARRAAAEVKMLGLFDTMKYLARGGRISPAIALAAGILRVKPVLTFRSGELVRAGLVRSRTEGKDRLLKFVAARAPVGEIAVSHSTNSEEIEGFVERLKGLVHVPHIPVFEMGAALGIHGGPGMIIVAVRTQA